MDKINYTNLGHKPSPKDYRNLKAETLTPAAFVRPAQMVIDPNSIGGVMMQSLQPSCTLFAIIYAMKTYWLEKTGQVINFNPAFLRKMWVKLYPDTAPDGGTDLYTVIKEIVAVYGCATFATCPDTVDESLADYQNPATLTEQAMTEAVNYKITGFLSVGLDINSLRDAIAQYKIVMTARTVGAEMYVPDWSANNTDPLRTPEAPVSGHCMDETGYIEGDDINILLNEWSVEWGNKGMSSYKGSELSQFIDEAFVFADVPQEYIDLVKQLPPEDEFSHVWNVDLKEGDVDANADGDVQALQIALMIEGFLTIVSPETLGTYGPLTQKAVAALQLANVEAILTPEGITEPTGNFGPSTRAWLTNKFN